MSLDWVFSSAHLFHSPGEKRGRVYFSAVPDRFPFGLHVRQRLRFCSICQSLQPPSRRSERVCWSSTNRWLRHHCIPLGTGSSFSLRNRMALGGVSAEDGSLWGAPSSSERCSSFFCLFRKYLSSTCLIPDPAVSALESKAQASPLSSTSPRGVSRLVMGLLSFRVSSVPTRGVLGTAA